MKTLLIAPFLMLLSVTVLLAVTPAIRADDSDDCDRSTECTQAGYIADPRDCRKYYKCVPTFRREELLCPEGYFYNEGSGECDHIQAMTSGRYSVPTCVTCAGTGACNGTICERKA